MEPNVKHVVVDSGAFIKNAPIREIGENVYSLRDVVSEIRDKATRQRLQVLPYEIVFKEPDTDAIRKVTDFSKKTGDYPSLSAVDIRVMALAYMLEKQHVGEDHIKSEPQRNVQWSTTTRHLENPTEIAGFYLKKMDSSSKASSRTTSQCDEASLSTDLKHCRLSQDESPDNAENTETADTCENCDNTLTPVKEAEVANSEGNVAIVEIEIVDEPKPDTVMPSSRDETEAMLSSSVVGNDTVQLSDVKSSENVSSNDGGGNENVTSNGVEETNNLRQICVEGNEIPTDQLEELSDSDDADDSDDDADDDDDDGWITPSNIKEVKASMGHADQEKASVDVACLTTDFAMQNVLIQMGLNVVSVDGMLIKRAKSYVLRCHACFKITTNMTKEFCFHCGNKTLQRVSMTVEEDGSIRYFLSKRKPTSTRGLKYSLPRPRGGKHAVNPILVPDQRLPHQRESRKGKVSYDVFDPDYVSHTSPFAPIDTHSRSAQLGIRHHKNNFKNKRNPNENKKVYGRRK